MNIREYRKANKKFEINFVNHDIFFKIKTGCKQTDESGINIMVHCRVRCIS
jgi:hypothetical protein